jgi:CHAT domain-containing protein
MHNPRGIAMLIVIASTVLLMSPRARVGSARSTASLLGKPAAGVRLIEPRLSGEVAWAPFHSAERPAAATREAASGAGVFRGDLETIGPAPAEAMPETQHTAGVMHLLSGRTREAMAALSAAAEALNEPAAWNDLAVAYHEAALRYDAPQLLADAVTAADRALSLDPTFEEALFNRALMIERLGLRTDARKAWSRYLAIDTTSQWVAEAQAHFGRLPLVRPFLAVLDDQYDGVASDPAVAAALVVQDPFGARGMGMVKALGRWGVATLRGDHLAATRHLDVARALGVEVTRRGDRTLERAVQTIETVDERARGALASAHADYEAGIMTYIDRRPVDAEPLLRRAAAGFERAGSPMATPALYFAANTVYEQGRHDEAERQIEHLLATTSDDYPAYQAFMLWQLGICRRSRADWSGAITDFERSAALFERIEEKQNLTVVHCLVSFVYDRIGDRESAWNHRIAALRNTRGTTFVMVEEKVTSAIAEAALNEGDWHKAASFLTLQADAARRVKNQKSVAETLFLRAVVRDRLQDQAGARADLAEARSATARVKDPGYAASLRIKELRATAMLSGTTPARAEALLTEALQFRSIEGDPPGLPDLLLQRARARRGAGNTAGALADIEQGIADLEAKRESLPEGEIRWGAFHAAEDLFEEGVALAMETGRAELAFRFAERARARALLDTYGRSPILDHRRLPGRTVVVEYVALPSRLVIFAADANGIHAKSVACPRDTLAREVEAFGKALRQDQMRGQALNRYLIEPVAQELLDAETIVFVPDPVMSTVAFSALPGGNSAPLIQGHAVVIAPSAAAFAASLERRGPSSRPTDLLLVSASGATEDLAALGFADREAQRIMREYPNPERVEEDSAQFDELVQRAPQADVIHFAGHAVGDDAGLEPATIVLRQNGRARRVSVRELTKLRVKPAATVVLAGCSTARGVRRAAEGVNSVAHGFLSAGAASVIATLWPIDDAAAARFFPRVHRRLATGMSPAEALRGAQLESIERGDVPVSLWAAVQNIGS